LSGTAEVLHLRLNFEAGGFVFYKLASAKERENPHYLCVFPLPSLWLVIHPFVALPNGRGVSPLASGDQRYARWIGATFYKRWTKTFSMFSPGQFLVKLSAANAVERKYK